jgi:hypothetical protein
VDPSLARRWIDKWEPYILASAKASKSPDREMGAQLGWIVSPPVNGFYDQYLLTKDPKWIDLLVNWTDRWTARGVKEPDGYIGWPKDDGANTPAVPGLYTDNLLGEAMALKPAVLMAAAINADPALKAKYGNKADAYLALAEKTFQKWDARGCWREIAAGGGGGVWVVPTFGIDKPTNTWTEAYARKGIDGVTWPCNIQNHIAQWMLALHEATGKPIYRERAEKWWKVQKSRLQLRDGKYYVWNYWEPAGPWDYKPDGKPKHWIGVHANGGYYAIDVATMVLAYEHGLVFDKTDIDRLIATNRDFMWNQKIEGAAFQRIDGGKPDPRWKDTPGVAWEALAPYDATLRRVFEANFKPDSWAGISGTPAYLYHMQHHK